MEDSWKSEKSLNAGSEISILEIDFPAYGNGRSYTFGYPGREVRVEIVPGSRSVEKTRGLIRSAEGRRDAVALTGFSLTYTVGDRYHVHKSLKSLLGEDEGVPVPVCDGIRAKDTIERWVMKRIVEELEGEVVSRRILVLSGLDRWGVSEIISSLKCQTIFGDLMYNFRFGIPLFSLSHVRALAPLILWIITRSPLDWYFPGARRYTRRLPRWRHAFYWAEVIVGGMPYLRRYSPPSLDGKVIITNIGSDGDIQWLKAKGASIIASLTPVVAGERVSASVMEVVLTLSTKGKVGHRRDRYLDEIIRIDPQIEIVYLSPSQAQVPAQDEDTLAAASPLPFVEPAPPLVYQTGEDLAKFCFVIHPLVAKQLSRHPVLRKFRYILPVSALEALAARAPSVVAGNITNLESPTGRRAEGWLLALPMTGRVLLKMPPEQVYDRLVELAEIGQELGATVMGLGAFTSVVGDAGISVAKRSPIAITTGNSYTVAATMETILSASRRVGIEVRDAVALVVGATGSIGSVIARLLAEKVSEIILVSPRPERLIGLGAIISSESPDVTLTTTTNVDDHIQRADIVVTTTSSIEPIIGVGKLKSGAVVCDVARPPDIMEESAGKRPDVLVIESGEIAPPLGTTIDFDIGLPEGIVYACLAETMILALEGITRHYTIGRTIEKSRVDEVARMGERHGFTLAGFRSFGRLVSEERLDTVALARKNLGERKRITR